MAELSADDFPAFFEAVYKYRPFAWQAELATRVLEGGGWPEGIDVPTGMGKTAVLDIAVFALAAQADLAADQRTAPTRTFVVVDRRLIVDQTHERATLLQETLESATDGSVAVVASALRRLSGNRGRPLEVVRMRGGVTWGWRWLASPDQPAIVVGTVDQFGSRLLFRGYGVGSRLRPIDAALTGADVLLVLDEAHISRPLANTTSAVHRYESAAEQPVLGRRHPRPVLLSATLPAEVTDVFQADPASETSDVAHRRLGATKPATLVDLVSRAKDPSADLARSLAQIALDRANEPDADRIAVVCNTIAVARGTFHSLRAEAGDRFDVALLIGRCREFDRNRIAEAWAPQLVGAESRPSRPRPVVVVSTQTLEVGADFDFDVLISELAPIDALLQRLGRLNRFGRPMQASAVLVRMAGRHDADPVYGSATGRTWEWLRSVTGSPTPVPAKAAVEAARSGPSIDLGTTSIRQILSRDRRRVLAADAPEVPEVIGPTLAAWARTSPPPEPDQPVAPFLHGLSKGTPEVLVCWRAGLPERHDPSANEAWEDELRTTPVVSAECVSVPIWQARRLLEGRPPRDLSDLEGTAPDENDDDPFEERVPVTGCIVSDDGSPSWDHLPALRPGTTLVVRAESGGHDEWGWTGRVGDGVVPDVADLCRRGRRGLRLRPALLSALVGGTTSEWENRFPPLERNAGAARVAEVVDAVLSAIAAGPLEDGSSVAEDVRRLAGDLASDRKSPLRINDRFYFVQGVTTPRKVDDHVGDHDEGASSSAGGPVSLDYHLRDVSDRAAEVAERLGLPEDLVSAVKLAGLAHDLGKADHRFQVMLHRGDRLRAELATEPLAKSGMDPADRKAFGDALRESRLPCGSRHEAGSATALAKMVEADPALAAGTDLDLVLHLVSAHHGYSRPLLPPVTDAEPTDVHATLPGHDAHARYRSDEGLVDWGQPGRFERLGRRYGWWGLGLLESIVRLADMACSEGYDRNAPR